MADTVGSLIQRDVDPQKIALALEVLTARVRVWEQQEIAGESPSLFSIVDQLALFEHSDDRGVL